MGKNHSSLSGGQQSLLVCNRPQSAPYDPDKKRRWKTEFQGASARFCLTQNRLLEFLHLDSQAPTKETRWEGASFRNLDSYPPHTYSVVANRPLTFLENHPPKIPRAARPIAEVWTLYYDLFRALVAMGSQPGGTRSNFRASCPMSLKLVKLVWGLHVNIGVLGETDGQAR